MHRDDHWLVRPATIRALWQASAIVLAGLVLMDLVIDHHPRFGIDGVFAFAAWYGFASCVVLILLAKALGFFLKRPDTYYDE
jgi:hypothetical protein